MKISGNPFEFVKFFKSQKSAQSFIKISFIRMNSILCLNKYIVMKYWN